MHVEGTDTFLWASGVEHHALYQYQFNDAQNIFAGFIQTETPYYMPNPNARSPFPVVTALDDPGYDLLCPAGSPANCVASLGLRINACKNILVYGAG